MLAWLLNMRFAASTVSQATLRPRPGILRRHIRQSGGAFYVKDQKTGQLRAFDRRWLPPAARPRRIKTPPIAPPPATLGDLERAGILQGLSHALRQKSAFSTHKAQELADEQAIMQLLNAIDAPIAVDSDDDEDALQSGLL